MDHWLSIEIFDGEYPARSWRRAHGDYLTEAAITNGALRWMWHKPGCRAARARCRCPAQAPGPPRSRNTSSG